MKLSEKIKRFLSPALLTFTVCCLNAEDVPDRTCVPLNNDDVVKPELIFYTDSSNDTFCTLRLHLKDDFKGEM